MNIKKVVASIAVLSSLALVGCSNEQPTSEVPQPTGTASQAPLDAESENIPEIVSEDKTDVLGEGLEGSEKPVTSSKPVDNDLLIPIPNANKSVVVKNEQVTFSLSSQKAGTEFDAVIFYANNEKVELGEFKADKDGLVTAEIVIPQNLVAGEYSFALTKGNELFVAPLLVK